MKTIYPETPTIYSFKCPDCDYFIEDPDSGSTDWTSEALSYYVAEHGRKITCNFCGETFRLSDKVGRSLSAAILGTSTSPAKTAAARQNGRKGGRPRKTQSPE